MDSVSVGNDLDAILMDRYPDIAFQLNFVDFQPFVLKKNLDGTWNAVKNSKKAKEYVHSQNIDQEMTAFLEGRDLEEVEIFYLYGVGLGYHYAALKTWLNAAPDRLLIILEESLGAIAAFLKHEYATEMLIHPQVHLHYVPTSQSLACAMKELIATFPSERIEVAAIASYARKRTKIRKIHMQLYRFTAVSHALMTEAVYSHKLLVNLIKNILRWPGSFLANGLKNQFKGIPAIICGAGPSLAKTFEQLKKIDDRALIIAGGSTISALSNQGILPHLGLALDPNHEEFGRLKSSSSFEMPLIYATRLEPQVFNTCNGERGYLISETGGPCETFFEKALKIEADPIGPELGAEAFSVTTLCIALAVEMGCNPIILNGIDLAYTGMQRYAEGVLPSSKIFFDEVKKTKKASDRLIKKKDIFGNPAYTLVKWIMESECISAYAKQHKKSHFINATQGGLGFPGIDNIALSEIMRTHLDKNGDLRANLHTLFQSLRMPYPSKDQLFKEQILQEIEGVFNSLLRLEGITEQMLQELQYLQKNPDLSFPSGKTTILEIDFQEEKAFECLLFPLGPALERLLNRAYYFSPLFSQEEKRHIMLDRQMAKWIQFRETILVEKQFFLSVIYRT